MLYKIILDLSKYLKLHRYNLREWSVNRASAKSVEKALMQTEKAY